MDSRTTQDVLQDHLALAQQANIETDIIRNFDPDCVLMTTYGTFRGHGGVREAADLLARQMGPGGYNYIQQCCHEELAFLEWSADTERASIPDGADSYWIKDGRIRAMTIHYSVHDKQGRER
ncbi:MAG TPA: nuclear transport factor 2 family protein [Gammaproteobacteria bacterium]|nr:nuclear transport factor 2 family protein [Gammaproteobacteria bacterium]